ncbi:MAG: HlyC/CorC family transporter [Caldilineaceae bacterium]|nr:HlyC/CorC family transporter [Caldilineaceae bacterium]
MNVTVIILVIILLIAINGLYVAGEFSAVSARRPRLAQMADEGSATARWLLAILEQPHRLDAFVAACQLGITLSSLVLGYYGQANIIRLLAPQLEAMDPASRTALESGLSVAILLGLTTLQVLFGELIPKNIGLQYPEHTAIITATPMRWSMLIYRPLIWLFNGSGQLLLRLIKAQPVAEHAHIHSPDEIVMLVEESRAGGLLDKEETRLLVNTLELRNETARKVMLPRNRMLAAQADGECEELLVLLANSPYSRLPLYQDDVDHIVGVVHIRDLLKLLHRRRTAPAGTEAQQSVRDIMRPVQFVPDSMPAEDVLLLMQREHLHLVIVVDEYGGTAGLITVEDLVEEIIGEFEDEFDRQPPAMELRSGARLWVRGDVPVDELNDLLDAVLPTQEVDTVGGLVTKELGRLPKVGDEVEVASISFRVESTDHNSVGRVSVPLNEEQLNMWQERKP